MVKRPWPVLGIGWLLAVIVVLVVFLALVHAIVLSETLVAICLLLLALAILL